MTDFFTFTITTISRLPIHINKINIQYKLGPLKESEWKEKEKENEILDDEKMDRKGKRKTREKVDRENKKTSKLCGSMRNRWTDMNEDRVSEKCFDMKMKEIEEREREIWRDWW